MPAERKPGRWIVILCLLSLALIVYTRLARFDFVWDGHIPLERITWQPLNLRDVPINVLFFIPLGLGLAGVLTRNNRRSRLGLRVLGIGLALSVVLEATQMFLPERIPSAADIVANGVGLLIGFGLFLAWEEGFGRVLHRYVTPVNLVIGLLLYALIVTLLTGYLYRRVRLTNWDTSFPLVVGNEATGDRPWEGTISRLLLDVRCDDPLPPAISINYSFSGEPPYENSGLEGEAPPLIPGEGPVTPQEDGGVMIGPEQWLITAGPFSEFSNFARHCHHIFISTALATADRKQRGPARIISISADTGLRNITISQDGDDLNLRLRTQSGGDNGTKPTLAVPDVFATDQPRAINVEYSGSYLRVEVDGERYGLSFAPGMVMLSGFLSGNHWLIDITGDPHRYDKAYWGIILGLAALVFGGLGVARLLIRPET